MICLGFDPGKHLGWARLDVRKVPGRPIAFTFLDGGKVEADPHAVAPLLLRVDLVAIEMVEGFPFREGDARVGGLIGAARVDGGIEWLVRDRGIKVLTISALQARALVLGARSATDAHIRTILPRLMHDGVKAKNVHTRDACVVAMAAAHLARRVAA